MDEDEVLDLVDENDEVIGEVSRILANTNPNYLHREVAIVLVDGENRILLQQRSMKKKSMPGYWTVAAAGHVGKGMIPKEVAHKELREELGFDTDLKFLKKIKVSHPETTHFAYLYFGKYRGEQLVLEEKEVMDARLFSKEEIKSIKIGSYTKQWCEEYWDGKLKL